MGEHTTCTDCGTEFEVPARLAERYGGWTPSRCRRCHARSRATGAGRGGAGGRRGAGPGKAAASGQGARSRQQTGNRDGQRLAPAEVLERYTEGPHDGVFTDGSAEPNPGPGGWGAVYVIGGEIVAEASGRDPDTTNNRMELTALIAGIDLVPEGTAATVHSDSRLVVDTATKWVQGWARNGWRRKSGPVQNLDLVKALHERVTARPEIRIAWIKAHAGSRWNEYADALASADQKGG